jgi:hypothetical protein
MKRFFGLVVVLFLAVGMSFGQAISVNGGSIQGTITDPTGAIVPGASVTITGTDTGSVKVLTTDSAGFYSLGPLNPGNYSVAVVASGFQKTVVTTVVRTGTATSGNYKLTLGQSTETVEVNAGALQINTDQAGVSDVITSEQIKSLPVNGRNFLDLAQIEPGVILQSGESFDPTKAGYSAISVGGVSGRTTRILLDGQDITDETVGTTIFNVSQGAINEFQLNRSTQDVSGEVTSTGQVLVSTNSGTNAFHGQLFGQFQDHRALFARALNGSDPQFQRNQFGGGVGGPILKDKLFFFGNAERIKQDSSAVSPVSAAGPFAAIYTAHPIIPSPYRETYSTARLDYNGPFNGHYFVRANYNVNSVASNFGFGYWLYANRDNTPGLAGGADYQFGHFTHSFRGSYEKFHNLISDQTAGNTSIYNAIPGFAFYNTAQHLYSGPNYLAPQGTFQSDKQMRYDGSWTKGAHNIRYGYSINRILGGGFAAFFGLSPRASESSSTLLSGVVTKGNPLGYGCNNVVGAAPCPTDPVNGYHPNTVFIGNGQGYFSEHSGFGLPGGGVADWRQGAYVQDSWKVSPSFTMNIGVRWSVDTDRANQDLATPVCSDIQLGNFGTTTTLPDGTTVFNQAAPPCTGSTPLFNQWNTSLGAKVHQPYGNFGPQAGFAYSPGNHNTSIRAAFGIFYEGDVFNNTTNARSSLLKQGAFFDDKSFCAGGGTYSVPFPDGTTVTSVNGVSIKTLCGSSMAVAGPAFIQLQQAYQANTKANSLLSNGGFVGSTLTVNGVYGAPYRTPYSEQWNGGVQHQIFRGAIISADYIHNSTLKIGQQIDQNHVGAARYLNKAAANAAISSTLAYCNAASINAALAPGGCAPSASSPTAPPPTPFAADITTFANNGLDSGNEYLGGTPAYLNNLTPSTGAAFPGINPLLGNGNFILPIGRSGYDALQIVYRQVTARPVRGIEHVSVQASYNLSRIVSSSGSTDNSDQFFSGLSYDNDNPNAYMGRTSLDHKHQVTLATTLALKHGPQIGIVGQFRSAIPTNLTLDSTSPTAGIFQSDVTGDGSIGDIAPGTLPGAYMHSVKSSNLQGYINKFNSTQAGQLTPAGNALVSAGLFTQAQLVAANATIQQIAGLPQATALNNPAFRSMDMNLSYPVRLNKIREGLSLEPSVAFYNVFNFSNFHASPSGILLNTSSTGGTTNLNTNYLTGPNTYAVLNGNRDQRGSGTFDQGAARSAEFALKLNF